MQSSDAISNLSVSEDDGYEEPTSSNNLNIPKENLNINFQHFEPTEADILASENRRLLTEKATILKDRIKRTKDDDARGKLIDLLVQVQIKLAKLQESDEMDSIVKDIRIALGHKFTKSSNSTSNLCEYCGDSIWSLISEYFYCISCACCVHNACLKQITRCCPFVQIEKKVVYESKICPEIGLVSQNFKCAECRKRISYQSSDEPRLCDYNGMYYCKFCHWNDKHIIPARIVKNWDIREYPVCRYNYRYLQMLEKRPILNFDELNPSLFILVSELDQIRKIREGLLKMKCYLEKCKSGINSKILLKLKSRQHFVENCTTYSLADVIDLENDILLPFLIDVHSALAQHIKTDCGYCRAQGEICKLCNEPEVLFNFDHVAIQCKICSTFVHTYCFGLKNYCPNCNANNDTNQ